MTKDARFEKAVADLRKLGVTFKRQTHHPAQLARDKGWQVGDVLEGTETYRDGTSSTSRIRITSIGEQAVLAREVWRDGHEVNGHESSWGLDARDWRKHG